MRNFFIILTVILSVSLLSGMTLVYKGKQKEEERELDKMQHVIYSELTNNQIDMLEKDNRIESMFLYKRGENLEVDNYIVAPYYFEMKETTMDSVTMVEGHYPTELYEIAVDKKYMEQIGQKAELGKKLSFTFLDGSVEEFTISGFTDTGVITRIYSLYLSKEYADQGSQLKGVSYSSVVRINNAKHMEEKEFLETIRTIGSDYNIERRNINENNAFVISLTMTTTEMLVICIIGFGILLVSVLVISSIFYISVISRIRQFGQFRTLGMTKKQIHHMINLEGTYLCLIGTPIGILIGNVIAYIIVPKGWDLKNTFLVDALVFGIDLVTVLFSIRKPAKIAGRISPTEATRISGNLTTLQKGKEKRKHKFLSSFQLAKISARNNRKKTLLTIISLGVAGVLFLVGTTFLASINREEYARQGWFRYGEFNIYLSENAAETNPYGYSGIQQNNPIDDNLIQKIKTLDGVKDVEAMDKLQVKYSYHDYTDKDSFVSFKREDVQSLKEGLLEGDIDYDKMTTNNEVLISSNDVAEEIFGWKFQVGDSVTIRWYNGKEEVEREFKIAGSVDYAKDNYKIIYNAGWFIVPEDTFRNMMVEGFNLKSDLIVTTKDYARYGNSVESELNTILDQKPTLQMDTLRENLILGAHTFDMMKGMIMGLAAFISCFALINLINTLMTNVMMRKQEFAVLQSIGMEKRQLASMIQVEGLLLAAGNLTITLLLGTACGYGLVKLINSIGADYMHYHFPIGFMIGYTIFIFITPVLISGVAIRSFQKKSLVERIREME